MDMRTAKLFADFAAGRISRRTFVRSAMAMGLSLATVGQMLRATPVRAQDGTPAADAPPVVAEAGSGDPA